MTTIYVAWHSIFGNLPVPWNGYNKHSYLVRDLDSNLTTLADQEIIRGGVRNLTFEQVASNLQADGTFTGPLAVEAGVLSSTSDDGLNNTGNSDGDAFLNNDKDHNGVADTVADRHYTAINLAPAFAYLGTTNADAVWAAMEAYAQDLEDSDFGYRFLSWNCQATTVSVLASVKIDFFNNVPTGSIYTQYISRDVLLSGDGGYTLFGFGGNDKIFDTGGNDIFHGGDGSVQKAVNYLDGVDRITYAGDGDVTYRYVILGGGNSAWSAIQSGGTTVSTDTLYSMEQFRGASFPLFNNTIDLSDYGSGLTIEDETAPNIDNYQDDAGDKISAVMKTQMGTGNVVSFIDMKNYIGTDYADSFSLTQFIGRRFDGGDGDDNLTLRNDSASMMVGSGNRFVGGSAIHIADAYAAHHAGRDVAINIENFDAPTYGGYYVVESMGNDFTFAAPPPHTSVQPIAYYTMVSYANYSNSITFDLGYYRATDGTSTDTFNNVPGIIGSNNGDTYRSFPMVAHTAVPIFTGSGNDTFHTENNYGPIYYGGGNDYVEQRISPSLVAPFGVELADISWTIFNTRLISSTEFHAVYGSDVRMNINGYGSITFEHSMEYEFVFARDDDEAYYSTLGGPTASIGFFSPTGLTWVSLEANGTAWNLPAPPTYSTRTTTFSLNLAVVQYSPYKGAYHGSMGADVADLSVYTNVPNFFGYEGNDTITGSAAANNLYGGGGNDVIYGGGGNDTIEGGEGVNTLQGGAGIDTYKLSANSTNNISDTQGSNVLIVDLARSQVFATLNGNSVEIQSASGSLHASIADYRSFVTIGFSDGGGSMAEFLGVPVQAPPPPTTGDDGIMAMYYGAALNVDLFAGNDTFTGTAFADTVFGNDGNDVIDGYSGDDSINGGNGNDVLTGGNGNDVLIGGAGNDELNGGSGTDTASYASATAGVTVTLATNATQNTVGAGNDKIDYIENLIGSAFDDRLTGDSNANDLYGGAGNDALYGGAGANRLYGEAGNDTYHLAAASTNTISDTSGTNTLNIALSRSQVLTVLNGNALEISNAARTFVTNIADYRSFATVTLTDGTLTMTQFLNTAPPPSYTATTGNDTINASAASSAVTINLLAGNDIFTGSNFNDNVTAGDGNDTIEGRGGDDVLNGGNGVDTVTYNSAASAVTVSLATAAVQNTVGAGSDTISGFENLTGSAFNDTLTGDANANIINGGDGNDTAQGGAGNDTLNGGNGTDTVSYSGATSNVTVSLATTAAQNTIGAGTDTLSGFENLTGSGFGDTLTGSSGANVIDGGSGNDTIQGGAGNDTLIGGAGIDRVTFAAAAAAVTVSLATTVAQNTLGVGTDTISGFENLTGSAFNDILTGSSGANNIDGGNGNDTIQGGAGDDILIGGSGTDLLSYTSATSAVTVNLATTTAQVTGGAGTDTISGFENLTGSAYNDVLTGDGSFNVMTGAAGNDTLNGAGGVDTLSYANAGSAITMNLSLTTAQVTGGAGTDTVSNFENLTGSAYNDRLTGTSGTNIMIGNAGNDTINAGGGTDILYGDAGADILTGGTGGDLFIF